MKKLMMALTLIPLMALADTEIANGIEWWFTITDGKSTVGNDKHAVPYETIGAIEIPSTLGGCPVTSIGDYAFDDCCGLTAVTIPSSVTNIGVYAFRKCSGLMSVMIPSRVVSVGNFAFAFCNGLTSVTISNGVRNIGNGAFNGCSGLTMVGIPSSVETIGEGAFSSCNKLEAFAVASDSRFYASVNGLLLLRDQKTLIAGVNGDVILPPSVTNIGVFAFSGCSGLTSVTIPASVTSIGRCAFQDCTGLTSVTIPMGVMSIGEYAFSGCSGLTTVRIPSSVMNIKYAAFSRCCGLMDVQISSGVTSIGEYAFSGCSGLISVMIPSSVTSIGSSAFSSCGKLNAIVVDSGDIDRVKGLLKAGGINVSCVAFVEKKADGVPYTEMVDGIEWTYVINNGETCVGDESRETLAVRLSTMGAISIPQILGGCPVTSIGNGAFAGCIGLTSVTIPSSVASIGDEAFCCCNLIKDVYFKGLNPPCLGADVFGGCDSDLILHAPHGWIGRSRVYGGRYLEIEGESGAVQQVNVTVTNVVVNYVFNSVQPQFAKPASSDVGFVNIIAEVTGGCVAVPATWTLNYPKFTERFGSDFTKALAMKTGKKDGAGSDMFVWQDYVAGTDPTKEDDVFTASITIVDGEVKVSYTPELDDARKALRKYTTWGKKSLLDAGWTEVEPGKEADFNFFKVMVEMR